MSPVTAAGRQGLLSIGVAHFCAFRIRMSECVCAVTATRTIS